MNIDRNRSESSARFDIRTYGTFDIVECPISPYGTIDNLVPRIDTLAREVDLFTTNRQETITIKEIHRSLFVVPRQRPADFFE